MSARTSRGRRPGAPDTRAEVLTAARDSFAEKGFRGTTIRAVAASAGVDPALVHHYFGTKRDLFVAALELPVDPRDVLAPVVARGPADAGEGLVRAMLGVWDDPERRLPLVALARHLLDPEGARVFQDGLLSVVIGPVLADLGVDDVERRLPFVASQIVGLIVLRYLIEVQPLASLPAEEVVAMVGPTIQRYLTGPLPA